MTPYFLHGLAITAPTQLIKQEYDYKPSINKIQIAMMQMQW